MPEVAAERGLRNPFDPLAALPHSGRFLKEHVQYFGNLALAAAAYNAGARRVTDWLARRGLRGVGCLGYFMCG
jgi:soluble lytic murein transglycosylase-like protein